MGHRKRPRWWPSDSRFADFIQLLTRNQGGRYCAYCGRWCDDGELTLDHVVPLADGGPDTLENLVLCCLACNQRKGRLPAGNFAQNYCSPDALIFRRFPRLRRRRLKK